jgi:hypothetical protein
MGVTNLHAGFIAYEESTHGLVSINTVEVSTLSVSDLHLHCLGHNMSGYKNNKRSHMLLLIVLCAWAMVVENIMYSLLPVSDDGNNRDLGIVLSNKSSHQAGSTFVVTGTDDNESVMAEED